MERSDNSKCRAAGMHTHTRLGAVSVGTVCGPAEPTETHACVLQRICLKILIALFVLMPNKEE